MKPATAILSVLFFLHFSVSGQLLSVKNSFQTDIANVLSDYPNGFKNIIGEQVMENPQTTEYACKATVKDATKCNITRYSSPVKEIYSWEAEMLRSEDFEEASKKFRSYYNSLQNLSANLNGVKVVFKGEYIKPSDAIRFTTILFDAGEKHPDIKNLKIGLVLEAEQMEWVIKVQVYEREREDKDRGPIKD